MEIQIGGFHRASRKRSGSVHPSYEEHLEGWQNKEENEEEEWILLRL